MSEHSRNLGKLCTVRTDKLFRELPLIRFGERGDGGLVEASQAKLSFKKDCTGSPRRSRGGSCELTCGEHESSRMMDRIWRAIGFDARSAKATNKKLMGSPKEREQLVHLALKLADHEGH